MVARDSNDHKKSHKVPQLTFEGEDNMETAKLFFIFYKADFVMRLDRRIKV